MTKTTSPQGFDRQVTLEGRTSPPLGGIRRHSAEIRWEGGVSKQSMTEKATFVHTNSGTRRVLQLKHATPARLVLVFGLREPPQLLTRADTQDVVFAEGSPEEPYSDLEPGAEYEFSAVQSAMEAFDNGFRTGPYRKAPTGPEPVIERYRGPDGRSNKAPAAPAMPPRMSNNLGMDDIQRAIMCCQAIYQDGPEKVVQFLNKPENICHHNFGEVCVSRYGRLTYMLAETEDKDELFIAFRGISPTVPVLVGDVAPVGPGRAQEYRPDRGSDRGSIRLAGGPGPRAMRNTPCCTESYEDILSDLSIWQGSIEGSAIAGKCHAGFLKLASCFPVDPILRKYVYSRGADDCARIVVCGHSMGGAVAHIVTLNMLADLQRCSRDTEKILSIAIGSPFFGDRDMRNYAEKHELSDNLLTIVNQNDPVPRLLQLAEAFQCATELGTKKVQSIVEKTLPILRMSLQALSFLGIGGQALATAASAIAVVDQLPSNLEQISQSVGSYVQALEDNLRYTPIGWYMLITHYRPPGVGQRNQWYVSYIEAAGEVVKAMREVGKMQLSDSSSNLPSPTSLELPHLSSVPVLTGPSEQVTTGNRTRVVRLAVTNANHYTRRSHDHLAWSVSTVTFGQRQLCSLSMVWGED
ncbi:hypothetical protein Bbelb_355510 [Branchiostoma belcheri]|nr:hypothetical protein Bbelb_355510 [Branchiostoma belcheri]